MFDPGTPFIVLPPPCETARNTVDLAMYIPDDLDAAYRAIIGTRPATPIPLPSAARQQAGPIYVKTWNDYVGQAPMKAQLRIYIQDALHRIAPLPHTLLASGVPGAGKTTLARLIAQEMDVGITELAPPFTAQTLYDAAIAIGDQGILFIDEIHKLADNGPAMAENLLHLMEEGVLHIDGRVHYLADLTLIGATTEPDKLPETIIDRFPIKPHFQRYSDEELFRIALNFASYFDVTPSDDTLAAIALACRGTPRIARELVIGARALLNATGTCTPAELLSFKEVEPDGMTRQHVAYLLALYESFGREVIINGQQEWEYIAGESSLMTMLRENKTGLLRLERFLIELGLIDRTPRGRRLTQPGIVRTREFIHESHLANPASGARSEDGD